MKLAAYVPNVLLEAIARYYDEKFREYGATPRGVDWNSDRSQRLRFEQLLKIAGEMRSFSLLDYGCGYGALLDQLIERDLKVTYTGFELSQAMIEHARHRFAARPGCRFVRESYELHPADYVVASGIFNVKLDVGEDRWKGYVLDTLAAFDRLSERGFAFNVLTRYSDPERMRPDLYYADPATLFDHCKQHYSRNVALLHDYGLYEFTILVRKDA